MKCDPFRQVLDLLGKLDAARIAYRLRRSRPDALMVQVNVPGERWEIEFVDYGEEVQVEVEKFCSSGVVQDETALEDLFARFSDREEPVLNADSTGHA